LLSNNENALDVVDDIKNENMITVRCSLYEQATAPPKLSRALVTLSLRFPFEKELFFKIHDYLIINIKLS
jgi:hypothetical protein